jgi:hypothetical protein
MIGIILFIAASRMQFMIIASNEIVIENIGNNKIAIC